VNAIVFIARPHAKLCRAL